jgi:hypothetical protein
VKRHRYAVPDNLVGTGCQAAKLPVNYVARLSLENLWASDVSFNAVANITQRLVAGSLLLEAGITSGE